MSLYDFDRALQTAPLCGVDEAGRGPLAGPVCAAAVVLPENCAIEGVGDSKKLSAKKREQLYDEITAQALTYGIAFASVEEIDTLNILNATMLAMQRAVQQLSVPPKLILADGNRTPDWPHPSRCLVGGDGRSACVAAASILAKVTRDRLMMELDETYPQYGFCRHKGYGTKAHYAALDEFGPSPVHRRSFLRKWSMAHEQP